MNPEVEAPEPVTHTEAQGMCEELGAPQTELPRLSEAPIPLDPGALSMRTYEALRRAGFYYLNEVALLTRKDLLLIDGIGRKGVAMVERSLLRNGFRLGEV